MNLAIAAKATGITVAFLSAIGLLSWATLLWPNAAMIGYTVFLFCLVVGGIWTVAYISLKEKANEVQ